MYLNVLTIMGFTVIVAVIGHILFNKTGVPESVFMILFGLILGPLTGTIGLHDFSGLINHVFTLSIIIILLESGLTTDIHEALITMRTSTIFTVIVLFITSLICSGFLWLILGWSPVASLILGVICSGTSTLPIMYFTRKLNLNPVVSQMLVFESVINDVTVITTVALIIQAVTLNLSPSVAILNILQYLVVAVVLGFVFSIGWTLLLVYVREELSLKYLITLAASTILHSLAESLGGSGVIAVLVFGIMIGNLPEFFRTRLYIRRRVLRFFTAMDVMQDEVSFLVKNTFFFLLGVMFNIKTVTLRVLVIALVLTGLMIVSRWLSYKVIGVFDNRYVGDALIVSLMVSRGLTAGLTAFIPVEQGLRMPPITDIVIVMILFTNLAATAGFMIINKEKISK
jgi:potassium/hydrogen antiporter